MSPASGTPKVRVDGQCLQPQAFGASVDLVEGVERGGDSVDRACASS